MRRPSFYKIEIWNFYFKANYTYPRVLTRTSKRFYNLSVSHSLIVKRIERLHQTAFATRFTSREGDSVLRGSLEGFMKISFFSPIYSRLSCFFSIPLVRSFDRSNPTQRFSKIARFLRETSRVPRGLSMNANGVECRLNTEAFVDIANASLVEIYVHSLNRDLPTTRRWLYLLSGCEYLCRLKFCEQNWRDET